MKLVRRWFEMGALALLLGAVLGAAEPEAAPAPPGPAGFRIRLALTHGHLREVFFGCTPGASAGFDHKFDSMAPPPGRETGYTAFVMRYANQPVYLYEDMRSCEPATLTWQFLAQVYETKTIVISWDAKSLPADHVFTMTLADGTSLDMRTMSQVEISQTQTLSIAAVRPTATDPAAEAKP